MPTLRELARQLASGELTTRGLVDRCLSQIEQPDGEGSRAFVYVDAARTRVQADKIELQRRQGVASSPIADMPISIKDLFDVVGQVTRAGSRVLGADGKTAERDALPIANLRAAGAVFVGRTNMTEFAYSGVGLNPHYGTPANPFDRKTRRIPGGSTSGGAVSVSDGMAAGAIGTDTGGSCRIPAALCGLVGFKPTARRISLAGCVPLAPSLDSVGCIGRSVDCVARLDAVMARETAASIAPASLDGLRFVSAQSLVHDRIDDAVANSFQAALGKLSAAGAKIADEKAPVFARLPELADRGGLTAFESHKWHHDLIVSGANEYDPRVLSRIKMGAALTELDHRRLLALRTEIIAQAALELDSYHAVIMPTVPIVAPPISAFSNDDSFADLNRLLLRNPSSANLLDRCAISLPCHSPGTAPVGISLMMRAGDDRTLLAVAAGVEHVLSIKTD